jgi:pimeloyl-ACP methyl ester carboxylesterase
MGDNTADNQQSQSPPKPLDSGYVKANGLQMYYEVYGAGRPLILLHGGTAAVSSWYGHIPTYAKYFRTFAIDSRGHGKTDNPAGELSYATMADDVAAFIRGMKLDAPLILGFSDGAQIALELGLRHAGLIRALVLGGAYYRFSERYQAGLRGFGFEKPAENGPVHIREIAEEWAEYLRHEHVREGDPDYWKTLMDQIAVLWWTPLNYTAEDFATISVPTLIVSGDREEASEVEQSVEMYQMIRKSELFIVPNAGNLESAEQMTNDLVIEFLQRNSIDQ